MGSIEQHGSRWQARWRSPDGEGRARNFARKADAEDFLLSVEHAKRTAAYVDPTRGRVSFRSYAEEWRGIQAGVPHAPPRQFPDISPEAIQRFENARRLKDKEEKQ